MTDIERFNEFSLIERYFRPLTNGRPETLGLQDDAAVLTPPPGQQIVVTTDALTEGIHFVTGTLPGDIAHKALRVNLSDLASMGAVPLAYTLALALPSDVNGDWLDEFSKGLGADQSTYGIFLTGGDTTSTTGPLLISITAIGLIPEGKALTRGGAQPGDDVYVSGTIGDAALGLLVVRDGRRLSKDDSVLCDRYLRPSPRCTIGPTLIGIATACIDVSDGLLGDLSHICDVSGVSMEISTNEIPMSGAAADAVEQDFSLKTTVLTGGDDYELAFTAPPRSAEDIRMTAEDLGLAVTRIGSVFEGDGLRVLDSKGQEITFHETGYRHF